MSDAATAKAVVQKFWNAVASRDFDVCEATMARDIVRIGPRHKNPDDIARGRDNYGAFVRNVITQIPSYHNVTHELVVSEDGKRVYIHCTEWSAPSSGSAEEVEVPLVMICEVNDDNLISKIDIFWKSPLEPLDWTKAKEIAEHA